jgi:hypothetical protein
MSFPENVNKLMSSADKASRAGNRLEALGNYGKLMGIAAIEGVKSTNTGKLMASSLVMGGVGALAADDWKSGFVGGVTTSALGTAGAQFGYKWGAKGAMAGFAAGSIAGLGASKATENGTMSLAVASVATSLGASAASASLVKGGLAYDDLMKIGKHFNKSFATLKSNKAGMSAWEKASEIQRFKTVRGIFPSAFAKKDIGKGFYTDLTEAVRGTDKMNAPGLEGSIIRKANKFLNNNPRAAKYIDSYVGSPELAKAAAKAGSLQKMSGKDLAKSVGIDFAESLPAAGAAFGLQYAFGGKKGEE